MNVTKILGIVLRVVAIITLLVVAGVSLFTAYIVIAPDNFPKPFRLMYNMENPENQAFTLEGLNAAKPSPTPIVFEPGEGLMVTTGTKIINLADPSGRKYIRVAVVVEFAPDNPDYKTLEGEAKTEYVTEFNAELTAMTPIIDDTIITLLSTKTFDMLYTAEGKESLRTEMMEALNHRIHEFDIISVYFTEFVVE